MANYLEKLRDAADAVAGEIVDDRFADYNETQKYDAILMLGRAQATDRISVALSAEVIRFLEHFEKTKLYRALGHGDFVTFLKHCGLLQVTKSRYYERKKVLDKEGDPLFDALSVAGVPMSVRQHLLPGDVAVDGDNLVIKGDSDEEDIIVRRDDDKMLVQSIRNLANSRRNTSRALAETKQKLDEIGGKHAEEKRELYEENDRLRSSRMADMTSNPHMLARVEAGVYVNRLVDAASALSVIEKDQFRDAVLEDFARWLSDLSAAYKTSGNRKPDHPTLVGDDLAEKIDHFLNNDVELADAL